MHIKIYEQRANSARKFWLKSVKTISARIPNVDDTRKQGLRKHMADSNMRYTDLYNHVADWAYARVKSGDTPLSISNRLTFERQRKLLLNIRQNDDTATWIDQLNLKDEQVASVRDAGHLYNAQWLLDHDTRWGVALIDTVLDRMANAGIID